MADDPAEERAEEDMSLALFEGMADVWAEETNLTGMIENIAVLGRLSPKAPDDVRESFIKRQKEAFDAIARLSFIEGAIRGSQEAAAEIARLRAENTDAVKEAGKWRRAFDVKSKGHERYLPCPDHRDKVDARVTGCIVCRAERAENEAARLRARPTWREGVEAAAAWHDGQAAQYDAAASKAASSGIMDFCLREAESHRKCAVAIRSMKEPGHAG